MAICGIFKGGWTEKIAELMKSIPRRKKQLIRRMDKAKT